MEKSRIIGNPTRPFLGLIIFGTSLFSVLSAKEIFDVPFSYPSRGFDYKTVKTVSIYFSGNKDFDIDAMITSVAKDKADVVITGKTSLEGEALSPNLLTTVIVERNVEQKSWLVTIDTSINGIASSATYTDGKPYRSNISISGRVLVFVDATSKEVEAGIQAHLQNLIQQITNSNQTKPKLFVIH